VRSGGIRLEQRCRNDDVAGVPLGDVLNPRGGLKCDAVDTRRV
jgi:hypothetical protein